MRIAIVCDSEGEGACREIHEAQEVKDWLRDELVKRLGWRSSKKAVGAAFDEAFEGIVEEMQRRTVRVH